MLTELEQVLVNIDSLITCRKEWEHGLQPLCVINNVAHGNVLVVLRPLPKNDLEAVGSHYGPRGPEKDAYHCHRYWYLGDEYVCSIDGQGVDLEAVWSWLNNPTAEGTRKIVMPTSMDSLMGKELM